MYYIVYFRMWDNTCRIKYIYVESKYDLFAYIGYYKCTEIEKIDYIAYEEKELPDHAYTDAKDLINRYLKGRGEK